jgi:hypothetical protein
VDLVGGFAPAEHGVDQPHQAGPVIEKGGYPMNVLASLIKQGQRKFVVLALAGGVAASGTMVYTASNAAFNATTDNPTNAWSTGSVLLTDDDSSSARFTISNIISGSGTLSGTKCIRVDYDGTSASTVKLYATAITNAAAGAGAEKLGDYINIKVEQGTGGATFAEGAGHTCASDFTIDDATDGVVFDNTLTSFASHTNFAGGLAAGGAQAWAPNDPSAYKVYRFTWDASALPDNTYVQGKTFQCTFTWQAKSS